MYFDGFASILLLALIRVEAATKINSSTKSTSTATTTKTSMPTTVAKSTGGLDGGVTAGIVVGCVGIVTLSIFIGVFSWIIWRNRSSKRRIANQQSSYTANGAQPKRMDSRNHVQRPNELSRSLQNARNDHRPKITRRPSTPANRRIPLRDLHNKIIQMHKDNDYMFQAEFEQLDLKSPSLPQDRSQLVAMDESNIGRNRFIDILPFEETRVKLPTARSRDSDYINASYIDGYNRPRAYIATQGPLAESEETRGKTATVVDFFEMIWNENASCVIMLCQTMEQFRSKCATYWPKKINDPIVFGPFTVVLTSQTENDTYIIRKLSLIKKMQDGSEERREVTQWHFQKWQDMKRTEQESLLDFIEAVRNSGTITPHAPTIVHCSAGVGRTGSYIALDCLLQHITDHNYVDVFICVYNLRLQRVRMVQNFEQYILLFDALDIAVTRKLKAEARDSWEDGLVQADDHEYTEVPKEYATVPNEYVNVSKERDHEYVNVEKASTNNLDPAEVKSALTPPKEATDDRPKSDSSTVNFRDKSKPSENATTSKSLKM